MSSYKLWRDKGRCDKRSEICTSSRKPPSYLRLNSTGEVSSVQTIQGQTPNMCHDKTGCYNTSKRPKMSLCQSVVNGFSMSSMIDTASSYLNTASSYIESIYPYKTSKCLANSRSTCQNEMELGYMFDNDHHSMSSVSKGSEGPWPCLTKGNSQGPDGVKKAWTQEILGAIHSTVFNKDMSHNTANKPDRYIPPPVKHRQLQQEKRCCAVYKDPKLTPYNAKLLENSRRIDTNTSRNVKHSCPTSSVIGSLSQPKMKERDSDSDDQVTTTQSVGAVDVEDSYLGKNLPNQTDGQISSTQSTDKTQIDEVPNQTVASDLKGQCNLEKDIKDSAAPDWFEYETESKTESLVPLTINASLSDIFSNHDCDDGTVQDVVPDQAIDCADRMLHSWYSMDNDSEVKKSTSAQNVPVTCNSSQRACDTACDRASEQVKLESHSNSGNTRHSGENCENSKTNNESRNESAAKIRISFKNQRENTDKKNQLISVLYSRNGATSKRRPSAQKRIRHRIQKDPGESSTSCMAGDIKSPLKEGKSVHPNSSVAFILGLDCDQADNCFSMQSFQVNCDIEDLDWSSSDEGDSDCQFDDVQDCDEFDLFSPLKNLVNFQVRCSVESVPSQTSTSYQEYSLMDKINLEWEMNVAVKESNIQKKSTSKKVSFKSDNKLAEVHPIIAWSYAYQAARKGPWEEIARDRGRFHRRITDGEKLLKPILETGHRNGIFKERFESVY